MYIHIYIYIHGVYIYIYILNQGFWEHMSVLLGKGLPKDQRSTKDFDDSIGSDQNSEIPTWWCSGGYLNEYGHGYKHQQVGI